MLYSKRLPSSGVSFGNSVGFSRPSMRSIGGSRSVGFGMQQVRSLPDAVARALELHLETLEAQESARQAATTTTPQEISRNGHDDPVAPVSLSRLQTTGNLCSQCGCNTMVYEEGCRKCYNCGHSEC
jgi:ribonucleoside-diphosphate reductase alpha chain